MGLSFYIFLSFVSLVFLPFSNGTSIALKAHYSQDGIELDPQDPLRPHIVTKLSDSFFESPLAKALASLAMPFATKVNESWYTHTKAKIIAKNLISPLFCITL